MTEIVDVQTAEGVSVEGPGEGIQLYQRDPNQCYPKQSHFFIKINICSVVLLEAGLA